MKRTLCLFLALILAVGICFSAPVTITASAAADIIVTIDTGASVTLQDDDGDDYYDVGTADELYAFATAVNGGKKTINVELTANITINENVLTADGELNDDGSNFRVWTPIGYYNSQDDNLSYSGTFHGNDKTISGLYFNNSNVSCVGLFSRVGYGGKIENVGVIDSYTSCSSYVGGVVGDNEGTVTNCYNKGTVSGSTCVGGVVGSGNGTVTNCYNEGMVSGTGEKVGGVVGDIRIGTVTNCYNKGNISGSSYVGGVVGYSKYTVTNCYNEGVVSGTGGKVGGVVGSNNGMVGSNGVTVTNCYNKGTVSGSSSVGGVVGENYGTMTNCYNKGAVSGNSSVGGVVGYSINTMKNCYNEGGVSGTGERVGGVVGNVSGTVTNCYNKGNISGSSYVGGVVGMNSSVAVTNCYNEGVVSGTGERVGGVFGYNYGNGKNCYYLSGCATDGNNVTQFGIGNMTLGSTTADVSGQTDSKTADWFTLGEVCAAVGYHQGADATNGFCDRCIYDPATLNEDEYYEISNAGQLFWFANYINTEDRTVNAVLTADIDLENRLWTPIGKTDENSNNFRGHFDGQNHTIKGLYIERSSKGIGFFGEVRTGIVENFTIYGEVNVKGECDYVGGVFGSTCGLSSSNNELERNGAIIRNITSYVNLTAGAHGIGRIGGFVGYANHETLIENCSWYGTFDAGSYRVDTGAGGFIGNVHEGSNVTIRNCAAYGTIKTNYKKNSYESKDNIYMGGFLSYSESAANTVLENCLFAGKFEKGENLTDKALLGAFGTLESVNSIVNCYYLGDDGLEAVHSDSALKPGSDNVEITSVTKAQLLSGEVAYKLQGEENTHFWGQTIDTDDYPVLGGDKVYYGYISCADDAEMVYTNNENAVTEKPKHTGGTASCKEKAVCENCGDSYGDFAPHTYENGKCTAEGCGYACAHEEGENGLCAVCKSTSGSCGENVTWIYDDNTKTLTISGTGAMANYTGYDMPWYNYQSDITKVVIENGVTTIGDYAFWDCSTLTSVTIGDSVTTIGESAFSGCFGLTSVTIPYSVTTIGDGAFSGCTSLTSVTIPDNVTTIGDGAFSSCTELIEIKVAEGNTNYLSVDGILFNAEKTELLCYPAGKKGNYETPTTVTKIAPEAFSGNTSLESVIIPDSVTTIDDGAFMDCTALTSVIIPDSVTTIGSYAFRGCTSLASVTIGDRVTTIGWLTFYDCTSLTSVTIGKGVTEIGDCAFESCTSLTTIEIPDSVTAIGEFAFNGCTSLTSVTIGKGVTEIYDDAFDGCEDVKLTVEPGSYAHNYAKTNSRPYTFNGYTKDETDQIEKLTFTEILNDNEVIAYSVTGYYESISGGLIIPATYNGKPVTEIGNNAFRNCYELISITIPESVTAIGSYAFDGCAILASINVVGANTKYSSVDGVLFNKDKTELICYPTGQNAKSYTIPDSVITIGEDAFRNCTKLSSVTIGDRVTTIGESAFYGCSELTSVTIPESVTTIGGMAFYGCTFLETVTISGIKTTIGDNAFDGCNSLSTVNVPCDWDTEKPPYVFDENVLLKKYHNVVIDEAKAPTCTATGLTKGSHCTRCDDKTVAQEVVPALNHKDTLVQVEAKAPTCEAIGWDAYEHCTACDYTTYVEKAKLGHDIVSHSAKSATCEAIGWYAYDTCSRCDYTTYKEIAKLGHDIVIDKAVAPTCTKTGLTEGSHCTRCNGATKAQQTIAKKAHTEVTVTGKAATCTATGLTDGKKCSVCGVTTVAQQVIAATGHKEVTVTGKAATCTATGLTDGKKCSVCGTVTKAQQTIAKKGHTEVIIPKVAPTLTSTGLTEGKKCSVCGTVTASQQVIAKLVLVAPVITSITSTTGGVKFTWGAVPYAAKYKIYRKTYHPSTGKWDAKWKKINKVEVKGTEYVDSTAKLGTQYMYLVKAVNGKVTKNSAASSIVTFKISPTPTIHLKSNGIKVKWAETVVSAENYRIYRAEYNESTKKYNSYKKVKTVKGTTKSWTDTSVKSGKKYKYCVKAVRGSVVCDKVQTKSMYYLTKPKVTVAAVTNGIVVNWSAKGASKYRVYRSELQNGVWSGYKEIATPNGKTKTYTDTTAVAGVQYKYKIKAVKSKTGIVSSATKAVTR